MNRAVLIAFLSSLAAATAFAGVTYQYHMVNTGVQPMTISGGVTADGPRIRMEVDRGDGLMFKDDSIVISRDGGKTLRIFQPATKTFYEIRMDDVTRAAAEALDSPLIDVSVETPKVSVHDHGDGGPIEGLPTRRMSMDAVVNVTISAMGQKSVSQMVMHSETWSTDKIDPATKNLFQMSNPRTGIEAFDKVMDAQAAASIGRFPLKQVSTMRVKDNGREQVSTITTTVTKVRQQGVDSSLFADPEGYKEVENPIAAMKRRAQGR